MTKLKMMNKYIPTLTLSLMALITSVSVSPAHTLLTIKSNKSTLSSQNREISNFKGISSSGSFDVEITMGNKENLRIEGDKEDISEIETVVENGILKIRNKNKNGWNWKSSREKVTVYINAKTINSLTLSGSGNMSVNGTIKSNRLTNAVSGSGNISLSVEVEDYDGSISGSGEMSIKGMAERANIKISGSGNFKGKDLKTSDTDIKVSGSGNASVNAEKSLDAAVSGSGNIRYSGKARVSISKSGSGNISRI
ncbi:MAG: DUF2807 domain-containing protein [Flavobacterium sp.]|nr:DUF2807 domain-containing protein [Pedobacter sp.]